MRPTRLPAILLSSVLLVALLSLTSCENSLKAGWADLGFQEGWIAGGFMEPGVREGEPKEGALQAWVWRSTTDYGVRVLDGLLVVFDAKLRDRLYSEMEAVRAKGEPEPGAGVALQVKAHDGHLDAVGFRFIDRVKLPSDRAPRLDPTGSSIPSDKEIDRLLRSSAGRPFFVDSSGLGMVRGRWFGFVGDSVGIASPYKRGRLMAQRILPVGVDEEIVLVGPGLRERLGKNEEFPHLPDLKSLRPTDIFVVRRVGKGLWLEAVYRPAESR